MIAFAFALTLGSLTLGTWSGANAASAAPNPLANPKANRALPALVTSTGVCRESTGGRLTCPSPCFPTGELGYNGSKACTRLVLAAINEAQAAENRPGFTLPSNYYHLSVPARLFVLVNLERVSRGIPPLVGLSPYLDATVASAAHQAEDPPTQHSYGPITVWFPPGGGLLALGGAWAGDSVNAASAVFAWFYDDGWGGEGKTWNFACTGPTSSGCWGHRDELLGVWAGTACTDCVAGAAYASPASRNWHESYDFLLVRPASFPTPLVFTWDGSVLPHLPKGWERVKAP